MMRLPLLPVLALAGLTAAQVRIDNAIAVGDLCPDANSYSYLPNTTYNYFTVGFDDVQATSDRYPSGTCTVVFDMTYPPGCTTVVLNGTVHGFMQGDLSSRATVSMDWSLSTGAGRTFLDERFIDDGITEDSQPRSEEMPRVGGYTWMRYYMMPEGGNMVVTRETPVRLTVTLGVAVEEFEEGSFGALMIFEDFTFTLQDMVTDPDYENCSLPAEETLEG